MTIIPELCFAAREFLFPSGCASCGDTLLDRKDSWYGLCAECRRGLESVGGENRCGRCGRPLISEAKTCLRCRALPSAASGPERTAALYPYAGDYRKILAAYKFENSLGLGHFFAERLLEALDAFFGGELRYPVLIPVPPRPGKIKRQGWDQVEYLARLLEKRREVSRCLRRLPSRSQKELNQQDRLANLRGRVLVRGEVPKEAVLFDDVITTGATLAACAAPLKEAGAEKVYGLCLFYN
jgi:ComF family protein